jgi:acetyl-CoA carboxylase carboxyl transferase subunit beta
MASEETGKKTGSGRKRKEMPDLWMQCTSCNKLVYKPKFEEGQNVCPECNFHYEISSSQRIEFLLDGTSFAEEFTDLYPLDPLEFVAKRSYKERLRGAQESTSLSDACIVGTGRMDGIPVVFGVSDSRFLRGSMGSVVGEKIRRGIDLAREKSVPFIFVSGSGGGARMDEGILSLMQMAKTSVALAELDRAGGLFISVLTNPTMGGCMASFAALGDLIFAEPEALIGFAGPNVIKETIKSEIPDDFQSSEFQLEHGFVDRIVNRGELRSVLVQVMRLLGCDQAA